MRRKVGDVPSVELDGAAGGRAQPAERVQDGGLAGAVGADDAGDAAAQTVKLTLRTARMPP